MLNASQLKRLHNLTAETLKVSAAVQPALYAQMDTIMDPVLAAAQTAPIPAVEELIGKLPLGYYRQTLRVAVIERTRPAEIKA
jgi:hypothetical protein